ncbi:DNA-dependent metalloprotease SPRTN [Diretmus argenteus]
MDQDLLLAIQLQEQFDGEYEASLLDDNGFGPNSKKRRVEAAAAAGGGSDVIPCDRPLSIVDESWEMMDPSPDVRAMFLEFNHMFFWGKLSGVEVKWSPRMTLCAGVCSYEGRGGLCSIRLSEPLLKLRPRKNLVETLLHEMIHALLFVTQNNRDRDGHGPEFCKHMSRINKASGTNITVYHTFHDEVDLYRQHWWRCDGPCQNRKPYFGYVKRAMNRAPSAQDPWWGDHQRTCGGTYTKVKEPEGYGKKGKAGNSKDKSVPEKKKALGNGKPSSTTTGSGSQDIRHILPFSGKGFLLGGKSQSSTSSPPETVVISSPKKPFSSPPPKSPSPVWPGPNNPANGVSGASGGQKPPVKRSVSNTRIFVNINGTPVRIPKPHGSSGSRGTVKPKGTELPRTTQRSVQDLFNSRALKTSETASTVSKPPAQTKREAPSSPESRTTTTAISKQLGNHSSFPTTSSTSKADQSKYPPVGQTGSKPSTSTSVPSKYFHNPSSDGVSGAPASRKRPWDDHRNSANILDFFQKTVGSKSAAARETVRTKSSAIQQQPVTASSSSSSLPSSAGLHNAASSSSSSSPLMVSCPVCQAKVQESKINEHLDSCLS